MISSVPQPGSSLFAGDGYKRSLDQRRLSMQIERIRDFMLATGFRTLSEIGSGLETKYAPTIFPETSISAQLRNLKKKPHLFRLEKRRRVGAHGPGAGIWEYRLLPPAPPDRALKSHTTQSRQDASASRRDLAQQLSEAPPQLRLFGGPFASPQKEA